MRLIHALILAATPGLVFAAGGNDWNAPKPTETTKECKGVKVWDPKKKRCVKPKGAALDADTLYGAARELAYAGRYEDAQGVLSAMADQNDDRVLTYWGFTHRKMGNAARANTYYQKALTKNPDNLLARSYMGQGFVSDGRIKEAKSQLQEIRARGGAGTWPEASLSQALETGQTSDY
jgi:tetratricopeptide (TPR) repeat protein